LDKLSFPSFVFGFKVRTATPCPPEVLLIKMERFFRIPNLMARSIISVVTIFMTSSGGLFRYLIIRRLPFEKLGGHPFRLFEDEGTFKILNPGRFFNKISPGPLSLLRRAFCVQRKLLCYGNWRLTGFYLRSTAWTPGGLDRYDGKTKGAFFGGWYRRFRFLFKSIDLTDHHEDNKGHD
jgi:hypothetical protein